MSNNKENRGAYVGWPERIGFGAGFCGTMMAFMVTGSFLTIYMTNVALLDIAVVSSIMAVSRVFDGISDLIIGSIIDHTSSKLGKARIREHVRMKRYMSCQGWENERGQKGWL